MTEHPTSAPPLVSVIIPAFNAARFLRTAITSIHVQAYAPLEIIVVDDGSTDETAAIATRYPETIVLRQVNCGPASARNRGLETAAGEVIAFLDADDRWAAAMLPRLVAVLQEHPEVEIVQGLIQRMRTTDHIAGSGVEEAALEPVSEPFNFVHLGSALYRRRVFDRVGVFDESLPDNEDTDWMIRAWEQRICKIVIPELFYYYCMRTDSLTAGGTRNQVTWPRLLKRHRDRLHNGWAEQSVDAGSDLRLHEFLGVAPQDLRRLGFG
jgi:glycosyltransferase involved in cell wall biosynthesis